MGTVGKWKITLSSFEQTIDRVVSRARNGGIPPKLATPHPHPHPSNFGKIGGRSPHIWQNVIKHLGTDIEGEISLKIWNLDAT